LTIDSVRGFKNTLNMGKNPKVSLETAFTYLDEQLDGILTKIEKNGYDSLEKRERMIYLIMGYEADVRNGGIAVFLCSPLGAHVDELVVFLKEINANAVAQDLKEVVENVQCFFPEFPEKQFFLDALEATSQEQRELHEKTNRECSKRLFEYEPGLLQLLYQYQATSALS
jgi:Domain of unknown function (DUF4375)